MRSARPIAFRLAAALAAAAFVVPSAAAQAADAIVPADTAWVLVSAALVLLMTPALGFFYGGLTRGKNVLNTMMMSVGAVVVLVPWVLVGYSLAFGAGGGLVGDLSHVLLRGVGVEAKGTIPHLLFVVYQGTFVVITAALISGAVVERMRFPAYLAFITLWTLVVYAPVAHWVWGGGWLAGLGALDFAGGAVVHVNAAAAALVAALVVGPRRDYGRAAILPHHVPFVLLGTGLLWFGWFGFNGGSALGATASAVTAFASTLLAPAATLVVWMGLDLRRTGKVTAVGAATAIVVGLVAVTPAAGFVSPLGALALGGLAAFPSYAALLWRARTRLDDSLDVVAAHGVGGVVGALLTGVLADPAWGGQAGLLTGDPGRVGVQALSVVAVALYSGGMSFVLLKGLSLVMALRPSARAEGLGLDVSEHGEEAYTEGEGAILLLPDEARPAPAGALVGAVAAG